MNIVLSRTVAVPERETCTMCEDVGIDGEISTRLVVDIEPESSEAEYYISSVRQDCGSFFVVGKYVSEAGRLRDTFKSESFPSLKAAQERCRQLAKMKVRKKGFVKLPEHELPPDSVVRHFEFPPEMRMTPEELLEHVKEVSKERYVVFKNNLGMEEWFDLGVEYLGKVVEDEVLSVWDRFGEPRMCSVDRMLSIVETDESRQLLSILKNTVPKEVVS